MDMDSRSTASNTSSNPRFLKPALVRPGLLLAVLGVLFQPGTGVAEVSGPSPIALPSSVASPLAAPAGGPSGAAEASPSPSAAPELTVAQSRSLLKEFKRAQRTELQALKHRHSTELKELRASHRARSREWKTKENARRHELFAKTQNPQERRAYFKDRQERWDAYRKLLAGEILQRQNEQKARRKAVEQDQALKLREFNSYREKKQQPPTSLWPQDRGY